MQKILTIWKKELQDTVRDRRTLMSMVVLPMVLMPLIMVVMFKLIELQVQSLEEKTVKIAIVNKGEASPDFVEYLENQEKIAVAVEEGDYETAIREKRIEAAVTVPSDLSTQLASQQPVSVEIMYNSINETSGQAYSLINQAVTVYNQNLLSGRFATQSIDPTILSGVTLTPKDISTREEKGGFGLGFILPLFIVMWAITGGQYTAIDVSAGERERKTLEALLLTPVSRLQIVLGKFLAVGTVSLISVVVSIGSMYAAVSYFGSEIINSGGASVSGSGLDFNFTVQPQAIFLLLLISLLIIAMFAAILLSIAIFAHSFKEAESYISPSYLIVILPTVLVNSMPGFVPPDWFFLLPVVNAVLLFKEILIGTYSLMHISFSVISLLVCATVAIFVATKIYQQESVLFRE